MPAPQSLRLSPVVVVLAVTLAGAAVRLVDLGADSFDPAEVSEVNKAEVIRFRDPPSIPVASLSTWVAAAALHWGYGEATLRLPSAVAGTLTILAVWGLGVLLFGSEAGFYAGAAMAVAPLHVALSRTVGPDAWLTLFVTLTALTFMWAVRDAGDWRRQMVCATAALLACACGYRALLGLAAIAITAVAMAVRQPSLRRLAAGSCLLLLLVATGGIVLAVYHPPHLDSVLQRPGFGWTFWVQLLSQLATGQPQRPWAAAVLLASVVVGLTHLSNGASYHGGRAARDRQRGATNGSGSPARQPGRSPLCITWLLTGVAGLLFGEWLMRLTFHPADVGFVLPAYLLLGAAGLTWLRRTAFADNVRLLAIGGQVVALALLLAVELPGLAGEIDQHQQSWRAAAQVVDANIRPGDVLVVLAEQPSFAFYAPDLVHRMEPDVRPSRASGYFVHPKRGWLVAPARLREFMGWKSVQRWLERFPPVDLSPDAATVVLYMGQGGHDQLLFESAYFTLPTVTLVRGTLLLDWLQQLGPVPAVLWKVDQIALSREPLDFRNPSLLQAVYYLAQHNHGGRAASLAYRLATAVPDWDEAQRALEAFRPAR